MRRRTPVVCAGIFLMLTLPLLLGSCSQTRPHLEVNASQNITGVLDRKNGTAPMTQAQLQALVMNMADIYAMSIWQAFDEIRRSTTDPLTRAQAQYLKVFNASNATAIATGRNAAVNLLDMLVFVSLGRHSVETYWKPKVFGSNATGLSKAYRKLEQDLWRTSSRVLTEPQQKILRDLIQQWIAANPDQNYTAAIRLSDFAEMQGVSTASQVEAGNLLADVENAVAVAEQGLLVSERVMYLAERLPRMMTMQTELLLDQMAAAPDAAQLRTNLDKFTLATERLSLTAADLPKQLTEERQAAIEQAFNRFGAERKQVMAGLESQESRLHGVLAEVRGLLDQATPLTDKLNTTVHSADTLYRLTLTDTSPSKLPQYRDLLEKSSVAMDKLERILAEVTPLYVGITRESTIRNDPLFAKTVGLADHLFWRGILLISYFLLGLLGVRYLSHKICKYSYAGFKFAQV